MKSRNRIGYFRLGREFVEVLPQIVEKLMGHMIVLRCELRYDTQCFHYTADSLMFAANEDHCIPQDYRIEFHGHEFIAIQTGNGAGWEQSFRDFNAERPIVLLHELGEMKFVVCMGKNARTVSNVLPVEEAKMFATELAQCLADGAEPDEAVGRAESKIRGTQ